MKAKMPLILLLLCGVVILFTVAWKPLLTPRPFSEVKAPVTGRYLYVAVPGIRDYLGYGRHGILVFDINNNHQFVKRIKTKGLRANGKPANVKGVAVSVPLNSIYVSTLQSLQRIDLTTEKIVWEKPYVGGADRMAISPDGKIMYLPSLENTFWNVVDCETGNIFKENRSSRSGA